jgi:hypothetical protein
MAVEEHLFIEYLVHGMSLVVPVLTTVENG